MSGLRTYFHDLDGWTRKLTFLALVPIVWLFVASVMPDSYECQNCGAELVGRGVYCPRCRFAVTAEGEPQNSGGRRGDTE